MNRTEPIYVGALRAAPAWRREPYRVFFPLGLLLAWAGVLHWLLHALGLLADYQPVFHAIAQIQGFMICFALGFLFTAIPRRTGTGPPAAWQMAVAVVAPLCTTLSAWFQRFALSQVFWFALVGVVVHFAVARFLAADAGRRPPNAFVWVPLAFLTGLAGSALIGAYGFLGDAYYGLHELGRLLLLQGLFVGLVMGVGAMVLPLVTRGDSSRDAAPGGRDRIERLAHVLGAFGLVASFVIENAYSLRLGLTLRAVLTFVVLVAAGGIWRGPSLPGWQRRFVWIAAWMIPLGYALAAIFPLQKKAGLHVVFIGGFALMALSVALHVTLAHGGYERLVVARLPAVLGFGLLMGAAIVLRGLVDFDPDRFFLWIGCAAAAFLSATALWAWVALPRMWREARPDEE